MPTCNIKPILMGQLSGTEIDCVDLILRGGGLPTNILHRHLQQEWERKYAYSTQKMDNPHSKWNVDDPHSSGRWKIHITYRSGIMYVQIDDTATNYNFDSVISDELEENPFYESQIER